ncbi:DNA-3-methyladenine glycosylase I [Achromobacter xylosoxidans]|uniref:DNA-3-methyladenine glycosylase 1 n=1 Tax=Achromobacter aegrifaciens TaxID=1287736 RepID=A0AAD2J3T0_ACHAE|nr:MULTISPECIES: DNA-3-methyladenine glycosylase I [Achromobacter]PTN52441.1 DNA-3-methyladenine glycosylase I [Achromobacter xylosoxidans]MDH1301199.1 DNA-3-methyladenine glycosylase I [Achromobacter sp. GD03932]MDQ1758196.1 DNA-3-methyladenine glycosylase I [Achromobacter aegrifaciens]RSF01012.1 DNA-3-methyladenine glycosylase I [Achromobacter aegrifaciens]WLW61066.1 DNA-3-methyladenine glycosylase I [Achromobacter aegrifaciens]
MNANTESPDGLIRCGWVDTSAEYMAYHDTEWGYPEGDDRALFEQLCLEGFQSGLSWRTILSKRDAFRRGFANFEPAKVARFGEKEVLRLLDDAGIVRHRGKIEAVINNAARALEMIEREGSLGAYLWRFEAPKGAPSTRGASTSAQSEALSKALKKLGWKFVGPTTVYAFMQSVGMVNDHSPDCHCHAASEKARKAFKRPA